MKDENRIRYGGEAKDHYKGHETRSEHELQEDPNGDGPHQLLEEPGAKIIICSEPN